MGQNRIRMIDYGRCKNINKNFEIYSYYDSYLKEKLGDLNWNNIKKDKPKVAATLSMLCALDYPFQTGNKTNILDAIKYHIYNLYELSTNQKKITKIFFDRGERELIGKIKGRPDISVSFMHAREILEQLSIGSLDIGISGLDLLKESDINIQKNIKLEKKLNFGFATLVLACRNEFIDLFTTLDLDEVYQIF